MRHHEQRAAAAVAASIVGRHAEVAATESTELAGERAVAEGLGALEDRGVHSGLDRAAEDHRGERRLELATELAPPASEHVPQQRAALGRERADLRVLSQRGHVGEHPSVERRVARVPGHQLLARAIDGDRQRQRSAGLEVHAQGLEVCACLALDQRGQQRLLAGEVLIQRADAHAGDLRDAVGGRAIEPDLADDASRGLEDHVDRDPGTPLFRGLARVDGHAQLRVPRWRRPHHNQADAAPAASSRGSEVQMRESVLIVGGGIAGLVLARALARQGIDVDLLERSPSLRADGAGITLGANAMRALAGIGVAAAVAARGRAMGVAAITDAGGRVLSMTDLAGIAARHGDAYAIHRGDLHEVLAQDLEHAGDLHGARVRVTCGTTVRGFTSTPDGVEVLRSDGVTARHRAMIGADGVRSAVRALVFGAIEPRYAGYTCWRWTGAVAGGLERAVEMWGEGKRVGLVPLVGEQVYAFMVANAPRGTAGEHGAATVASVRERFAAFGGPFTAVAAAMGDGQQRLLHHDIEEIELPRWHDGAVGLIGDAAHAMTPNFGQGAAMAIEDAVVLARELLAHVRAADAFDAWAQRRRARVDDIQRGARRLGAIAQWESPLACWARDLLVRMTPASRASRTIESIVAYVA